MADISKFKRRNTLGAPPSAEEASVNLDAPELPPPPAAPIAQQPERSTGPAKSSGGDKGGGGEAAPRRDFRSVRRSPRTFQLGIRVSEEFDTRLRTIAEKRGMLLVEVLEDALDAYEALKKK